MRFVEAFDPNDGDVLYGTNHDRVSYIEMYIEEELSYRDFSQAEQDVPEPAVNHPAELPTARREAARQQLESFLLNRSDVFINTYNQAITEGNFTNLERIALGRPAGQHRRYINALSESSLSPQSVRHASDSSLRKGNALYTASALLSDRDLHTVRMILAIRRACKFGIEFISTMQRSAKVHYILDEIIMQEVVDKTERDLWTGTRGVPITTSEIRYIFRNWERYELNERLIFYRHGLPVRAPWVENPTMWLPYARDRVEKYRSELSRTCPAQLVEFTRAEKANNAPLALRWFYKMGTIES